MKYRISYETCIYIEADNEEDALLKAGETNMDFWQETEIECKEEKED